ncbi:MAG TPA: cysteine desulfurase family protein [Candidatus Saccharimonadales bacterium]|nr:cysteine desulfurase family protein [Candidatus Saccharimonadales bacterium]
MKHPIYLDYAAATPLDDRVIESMQPYQKDKFYNPSATYLKARNVRKDLENARDKIALTLGVKSHEIIFTAGGTEANNLAIKGTLDSFKDAHLIISSIEHESVVEPALNYRHSIAEVSATGTLIVNQLLSLVTDRTVLISVIYANNEVGTIQPLRKLSEGLKQIRGERLKKGNKTPIYFHTDATQAANYLDLHAHSIGVDLMTLNGGKIYGPKQSGILFVASGVKLKPLISGGGQELGLRNGTENVAADIGLAKALELARSVSDSEKLRLRKIQEHFFSELKNKFPKAVINGDKKNRLPNNVHVTFPNIDNEWLLIKLDEAGILAASGSACSASKQESSHVLRAMGISDKQARSSVRFTMGKNTSLQDIDEVLRVLGQLVHKNSKIVY